MPAHRLKMSGLLYGGSVWLRPVHERRSRHLVLLRHADGTNSLVVRMCDLDEMKFSAKIRKEPKRGSRELSMSTSLHAVAKCRLSWVHSILPRDQCCQLTICVDSVTQAHA